MFFVDVASLVDCLKRLLLQIVIMKHNCRTNSLNQYANGYFMFRSFLHVYVNILLCVTKVVIVLYKQALYIEADTGTIYSLFENIQKYFLCCFVFIFAINENKHLQMHTCVCHLYTFCNKRTKKNWIVAT